MPLQEANLTPSFGGFGLTYYPIDTKNCGTRGPSIWRQPAETFASLVGTAYQTRVLEPDGLVSEFESRQVGLT